MATDKKFATNIDNSDLPNYPHGRIKDDTGTGDGTPVDRLLYNDLHEYFGKLMDLAGIVYNGQPDNTTNGYQLVDAAKALAGKNDVLYAIGTAGGKLTINLKLGILTADEILLGKATIDLTTETQIVGSDGVIRAVIAASDFQTDDYLRLINTNAGITIVRLADAENIDVLVGEQNYLKATSQATENTGTATNVATTPASNKTVFARRVNGADSATYLADATKNGLLSKEFWAIINAIGASPIRNVGSIGDWRPGANTLNAPMPVTGNISGATVTHVQYTSTYSDTGARITLQHPMDNTNYMVVCSLRSDSDIRVDDDVACPVWKPISTTQFDLYLQDLLNSTKTLTIFVQVIQL